MLQAYAFNWILFVWECFCSLYFNCFLKNKKSIPILFAIISVWLSLLPITQDLLNLFYFVGSASSRLITIYIFHECYSIGKKWQTDEFIVYRCRSNTWREWVGELEPWPKLIFQWSMLFPVKLQLYSTVIINNISVIKILF